MGNPWSAPPTTEAILQQNERVVDRAVHSVERRRARLEQQEKVTAQRIQQSIRQGRKDYAEQQVADLVRVRMAEMRMVKMESHLKAAAHTLVSIEGGAASITAIQNCAALMMHVNSVLGDGSLADIIAEFVDQNRLSAEGLRAMDAGMATAVDTATTKEQVDEKIAEAMDEFGLQLTSRMPAAPAAVAAPRQSALPEAEPAQASMEDLQARLEALKKKGT